jgi:hypothetical protein
MVLNDIHLHYTMTNFRLWPDGPKRCSPTLYNFEHNCHSGGGGGAIPNPCCGSYGAALDGEERLQVRRCRRYPGRSGGAGSDDRGEEGNILSTEEERSQLSASMMLRRHATRAGMCGGAGQVASGAGQARDVGGQAKLGGG